MTRVDRAVDKFIAANGLRFHYRESGDPDAPPLLILHSITGHSWEWDPLAAMLADRYRVLAIDQRGHGASTWAPSYAPDRMVQDIAAIVVELGLGRATIVGHSMGGINGYLYAACHPSLVQRLVIVDAGPETLVWAARFLPDALDAWRQAAFTAPDEALAEWLSANPLAREPEMRRYVTHNLLQGADGFWRWRFDAARLESFVTLAPDPATQWAALRQVACATLVIRGAKSEALRASTAAHMCQSLAHGRLVQLAGAGHDVHIEQPLALLATVRELLTEN